ncbi:type 1 glutamine amidotransferase domain-containing protein [Methylophaga sp. OBS4]|uniref:type 1 glutamine amidotransferase domain-containing protein n=1 Tax=Methylophaga sp. OBS4 TaxID=2991935 RepID=UPI002253CC62|nr:type 1 glutamine amidotransferase domain-containing protein [Methylophaga sp. OBS4]MCX4186225.1 type 1 glutamine amidotransferase [Methylophaga sp. OBS4]
MRAIMLSEEAFEDSELQQPYERLKAAGVEVDIAATQRGIFRGKHGLEVSANLTLDEVKPDDYGLLLLPGGKAPARLRQEPAAIEIARHFFSADKPVAAICHGPQILISAGLLTDRTATCYREVASELREAGAHYLDQAVVVDGNLITSRHPGDLDAFINEILKTIKVAG